MRVACIWRPFLSVQVRRVGAGLAKMPMAMAVIIIMVVIVFIYLAPVCGGLTSVVLPYNSMFCVVLLAFYVLFNYYLFYLFFMVDMVCAHRLLWRHV